MPPPRALGSGRLPAAHAQVARTVGPVALNVRENASGPQDGIRFQGYRYMDPTLAGYVKEEVVIRYDPADLAEIRVFHKERFVCRAICQELAGQTVSLKEIEKARAERRKQVKAGLSTREALVEQFLAVHQEEAP